MQYVQINLILLCAINLGTLTKVLIGNCETISIYSITALFAMILTNLTNVLNWIPKYFTWFFKGQWS